MNTLFGMDRYGRVLNKHKYRYEYMDTIIFKKYIM